MSCSCSLALTKEPMVDILTVLIPLFALIILGCMWLIRPKPDFKTPETKAFNPAIFNSFHLRPNLFVNKSEQVLFAMLYNKLTPTYRVFSKVRLEDIFAVNGSINDAKIRWALRGRVKSRHVDFLITSPQGAPLMIIELDGASHKTQSAKRPDAFKNGLAKSAGLALRRVNVGQDFHGFTRKIMGELK